MKKSIYTFANTIFLKTVCVFAIAFAAGLSAFAQQPAPSAPVSQEKTAEPPLTLALVFERQHSNLEREIVPTAEAMPEEKFNFAPTQGEFKGVRTFAQQVTHVAYVNHLLAAALLGQPAPAETEKEYGPADIKTKAAAVQYLKDSFAAAHQAVASATAANLLEMLRNPFGKGTMSRLAQCVIFLSHGMDHYGQMVEYLRMNGIIPPASR